MARTKEQKRDMVAVYTQRIKESKAIFVLDPNGLKANDSTEIKKQLFDLDSQFSVVKNSLFKLALKDCQYEVGTELDFNAKAIVFSKEQVSESAKVIKTFMDKNKKDGKITINHGYLDGKRIASSQIEELAELPSREVMLARVLGTMNAPISGFVNVLAGNIKNFVNVVNAIKEQKATV